MLNTITETTIPKALEVISPVTNVIPGATAATNAALDITKSLGAVAGDIIEDPAGAIINPVKTVDNVTKAVSDTVVKHVPAVRPVVKFVEATVAPVKQTVSTVTSFVSNTASSVAAAVNPFSWF